jgi:hypothetical protein
MAEPLPELLDAKALRAELGVSRAAAERIMRLVPDVTLPGFRKNFCRREDVRRLLDENTSEGEWRFEKTRVKV